MQTKAARNSLGLLKVRKPNGGDGRGAYSSLLGERRTVSALALFAFFIMILIYHLHSFFIYFSYIFHIFFHIFSYIFYSFTIYFLFTLNLFLSIFYLFFIHFASIFERIFRFQQVKWQ